MMHTLGDEEIACDLLTGVDKKRLLFPEGNPNPKEGGSLSAGG